MPKINIDAVLGLNRKLSFASIEYMSVLQGFERAMQTARQDYEALNAQLLDELPTMFRLATSLFRDCVGSFVHAQKQFTDNIVQEMFAAGGQLVCLF